MISLLNRLMEISSCGIGIFATHLISLFSSEILNSLFCLEMKLHPPVFSLLVVPHQGMSAVTVHVAIRSRCTPIRKQYSDLVYRLWSEREKIPEHVRVLQISGRVTFLGVYEVGEFHRVSNEEYRGIVTHHIEIAFFCVELDCKSTRVAL